MRLPKTTCICESLSSLARSKNIACAGLYQILYSSASTRIHCCDQPRRGTEDGVAPAAGLVSTRAAEAMAVRKTQSGSLFFGSGLPSLKLTLPLKIGGWKMKFLFGKARFSGAIRLS